MVKGKKLLKEEVQAATLVNTKAWFVTLELLDTVKASQGS